MPGPVSLETNSWRVADAQRASLIIDADAYFQAGRQAMLAARRRIMLIGWDFDARIRLGGPRGLEGPEKLGDLILWLVKRRPDLEVYLLRWDIGAIRTLFRGTTIFTLMRWMWHDRIHTRLDAAHPTGASHHQKIVVIDDCFAFCGGIDMTSNRWDTRDHRDGDPRRRSPGGKPYALWHDTTTALQGPVAGALGELARERWLAAGGKPLEPVAVASECWPSTLGNVQPGDFAVTLDAMVISACAGFTMLLEAEWGEIGSPVRKSEVFELPVLAQSSSVDWQKLEYHTPYSTEVAKGDQFVGRADKIGFLASKLLRRPMESFYITGQKRIGKTSLALAAAEFAKTETTSGTLTFRYILWGEVAHANPEYSLRMLGETIEDFIYSELPQDVSRTRPSQDQSGCACNRH
jgi:hypothetical protein